jgi:hypothetical protein
MRQYTNNRIKDRTGTRMMWEGKRMDMSRKEKEWVDIES